jgi:DNA topoisomerase I
VSEITVEGYCVKCKAQRPIEQPTAVFTERGQPAVRGECPVCGTSIFRFGRTHLHEGLEAPEVQAPAARESKRAPAKGKRRAKGATAKGSKKGTTRRAGKLVVVESPAKARTISKLLGSGYDVRASLGHVRDLLKSRLSVDVEQEFEPTYRVPNEKKDVVKELAAAVGKASEIWLATDPDREGEAIAWHLIEATEMPPERVRRVVFHEITPRAIQESFKHPRTIDMQLVDAQQARRILDRLVGFNLSPLLWKKVRGRLSAGRVQSVALRMVVEREREIRDFVSEEYWSIRAQLAAQDTRDERPRSQVQARLHRIESEAPDLPDEETTRRHLDALEEGRYVVTEVRKSERRRTPSAPFTTSTLQQEASRRLGFGAQRTMAIAQSLYEGINVGENDAVGLITYMRTDSVSIASEAADEARSFIGEKFGADYVPGDIPTYKTRAKKAQEAHEAIRPTSALRTPEDLRKYLDPQQFKLYNLIWQRFIASQMESAVLDLTAVDIVADTSGALRAGTTTADENLVARLAKDPRYLFRATGSVIRFPGFLVLYEESRDEDEPEQEENILPDLAAGQVLDLLELLPGQHFTQPPPRFTEATLVRALEENGIGRPSTYAPIVNTLATRGYVEREAKRLVPTELGEIVTDLLVEHFPDVLDVGFTAQMEDELDDIAGGDRERTSVLEDFYTPFSRRLEAAQESMEKVELDEEKAGVDCERCGREMVVRFGRYGKFIACPGFPECRNTMPYLQLIGVPCPECGGELVEKRTKGGRVFYGCAEFPDCEFSSWKKPVAIPCPNCGGLLVEENRNMYRCIACEERIPRTEFAAEDAAAEAEPV